MSNLGEYVEQIKREQIKAVIEELEKIKAEIKQKQNLYYYNSKTDIYEAMFKTDTILKVIDEHIAEIKGEQE
jgi:hypothetical protein